MEITVRYGYVVSTGSLVWAITKRESDREGAFDWRRCRGTLARAAWRNGRD